jgi:hypothetical protein
MKTFLFSLSVMALLVACSKEGKKDGNENELPCPVVNASAVPKVVVTAFQTKYPSDSVITWFQKDSTGYCAYFIQPVNQRKLAEFASSGAFVSEEIDMDHNGNFEDSTGHSGPKGITTCECEIPE